MTVPGSPLPLRCIFSNIGKQRADAQIVIGAQLSRLRSSVARELPEDDPARVQILMLELVLERGV